ncbi:ABC transporter permease [Halospeciosus flavus]|uniref:ABC transporter permease n=1 Tax=Halospeciosus flavus TaxID=3032283 RepID=A0ABD5Z605_9EURY|nr:ABC transporter permease [Halospeciosus flavus]
MSTRNSDTASGGFTRFIPFVGERETASEFLSAPVAWLAFFLALPMGMMTAYSFLQVQNYEVVWKPTFQNYQTLLTSDIFRTYFFNTIEISVAVTILAILLGYPLAYAIAYKAKNPELWLLLVLGPFFTVYLIRAFSWMTVLGRNGAINIILLRTGLIEEPIGWLLFGKFAVIVGLVHAFLPYFVLTLYATLGGLNRDELEAARDLGASPIRAFWDVTLPQSLPGVITGSLFVFIPSFGAYVTPLILGGGTVPMLAPLLDQFMQLTLNVSKAAAGGIIMLVVVVVATTLIFRIVHLEELFSGQTEGGGGS